MIEVYRFVGHVPVFVPFSTSTQVKGVVLEADGVDFYPNELIRVYGNRIWKEDGTIIDLARVHVGWILQFCNRVQ